MRMWSEVMLVGCLAFCSAAGASTQAPQKDYLSPQEADKIRDAESSKEKIKLFVLFADDRLKKFQYELDHPSQTNHPQLLNYLMNSYVGCIDDAADQMQLGVEKQQNVRAGIDLLGGKTKEFREVLKKIKANGKEVEIYQDNLDDALEGTQDAMNDAKKPKTTVAPPPLPRKTYTVHT